MRNRQVLVPSMPTLRDVKKYLRRIDSTMVYSNYGPLYKDLVSRLAQNWDLKEENICILANGTLSLEGAIATSFSLDGEWVSPSWSFAATGIALRNQLDSFSFVDIDENWRMAPNSLEGIKGVMDVAPFGDELQFDRFNDFAGTLLVDAAASFDAISVRRTFPESPNSGVVISLHATKLIGAGEGGVFVSKNSAWVERVREWSSFGFPRSGRISITDGTNAKLSEYSAAVTHASLDTWPRRRARLLELQGELKSISERFGFDVHPAMRKGFATPYWIVRAEAPTLRNLSNNFHKEGWETRKWWQDGMHKMPLFSTVPYESLENTESVAATTLGLPFHQFLRKRDLKSFEGILRTTREEKKDIF